MKGHQKYIAHLRRNLNWLNNLDKKQKWSSWLQELLRKAVHWRNENPDTAYLCTHACDFCPSVGEQQEKSQGNGG